MAVVNVKLLCLDMAMVLMEAIMFPPYLLSDIILQAYKKTNCTWYIQGQFKQSADRNVLGWSLLELGGD
jgi:hypothetical protein